MTGSRLHTGRYPQITETVDTTDWRGPWRYENGALDRELLPMGYIKDDTTYYYHTDELGNILQVINSDTGGVVQQTHYYPYGAPFGESTATVLSARNGKAVSPYKFGGKEEVRVNDYQALDFSARYYYRNLGIFTTPDPCQEDYPRTMPMLYCLANPVNHTDPTGCDTVRINYADNKWTISQPVIAKGDDVFIISDGMQSRIFRYSDGEYGKRVIALNLENNGERSYNLGVYHVSGEAKNATGFYVTPGGMSSNKNNSGRRIDDGTYPIENPTPGVIWHTPGIGGPVNERGIRFHYSNSENPRTWTKGCFVLFTDYQKEGNNIKISPQDSKNASINFNMALGASKIIEYRNGKTGAEFPYPINYKLILKTR